MKTPIRYVSILLLLLSILNCQLSTAHAQGTAFTYQGRLNNGNSPANGSYDLTFSLFATNTTGVANAGPVTNSAVEVTNGLFTTPIDFGGVFNGTTNWLEVAVRTNGSGAFATLSPRQQLTPTPYAAFAESANNLPGLSIQQNSAGAPNMILGSPVNFVQSGVVGATIGGGGTTNYANGLFKATNSVMADFGTVSGGVQNSVGGGYGTVGGGWGNTASGEFATVGGGFYNVASNYYYYMTVGGGCQNTADGESSTVSGGYQNKASGLYATVGGGYSNQATNNFATVPGGSLNVAGGQYSFAASQQAQALHQGAFVWADSQNSAFSSTTTNQFSVRANGGVLLITGGAGMMLDGQPVLTTGSAGSGFSIQQNSAGAPNVILGSPVNFVQSGVVGATIGGGGTTNYANGLFKATNNVLADFGTVSGGVQNSVSGGYGTVGGGWGNIASGEFATVGGGYYNVASNYYYYMTVGGGCQNTAAGESSTVSGGYQNKASELYATVGGGYSNQATNNFATVSGGSLNVAGGQYSFAAGQQAQATYDGTFVWADSQNAAFSSTITNEFSIRAQNGVRIQTDKGIHLNANDRPMIVRDWDVFATNAPGYKAGIGRWGLFMEPTILTIGIPSNDVSPRYFQIAKYSTNGTPTMLVQVDQSGNITNAGNIYSAGTVYSKGLALTSDRNAKENFEPLDARVVLAKVAALPMSEWNYKTDPAEQKHVGPMAQDFLAAFGLNGNDDTHISVVDEGGVALAAIQGLNQKLNEKDAEIQKLKEKAAEVDVLKKRLNELEQMVQSLAANK